MLVEIFINKIAIVHVMLSWGILGWALFLGYLLLAHSLDIMERLHRYFVNRAKAEILKDTKDF